MLFLKRYTGLSVNLTQLAINGVIMTKKIECLSTLLLILAYSALFANDIKAIKRIMTQEEFNKFRAFVGIYEPGKTYNIIYNGYGTGLKPPTAEEWEKMRTLPIFIDRIESSMAPTLSSHDNSATIWFPPIGNQDGEGSCVSWACGYYTKTFHEAKEHNWDISGCVWEGGYYGHPTIAYQNKIFSPDFIYHQVNNGGDNGSHYSDNMDLLERIGCCTWDRMPYNPNDTTTWPGEEAWRQAPWYRSETGFASMNVETNPALDDLKQLLANHNLALISINADYYNRLTNKDLWTLDNYNPSTINHANTIVGYDDNFGPYTETGNNNTYGAFKVANSWGIGNWEKVADGYYISYKAMKQRVKYIYFYENKINYKPEVIAVFNLSHNFRGECKTTLGIGNISTPDATKSFDDFNFNGGNWPFPSNNMVLDITEFKSFMTGSQDNFFLSIYDGRSSTTGQIKSFSIEIYDNYATGIPTEIHNSQDPPVRTTNGSTVYVQVNRNTPQGPGWITVTYPNGGEVWKVGTPYEITWKSDKYLGRVMVEISTNKGSSWMDVTQGAYANNDGNYIYTPVAPNISSNCLFRVTSIENPNATDASDQEFTIIDPDSLKHYVAVHIPAGVPEPIINGDLSDPVWFYANDPEILQNGGVPDAFLMPWSDFSDNKVTWRAVWSTNTNLLYIAIEVEDDYAGAVDNDYDQLWQDDCIELFTDGDHFGGNYSGSYSSAQQWFIRRDNAKHLNNMPGAYVDSAINSAVTYGADGNWVLELSMAIYDNYPSDIRTLVMNDVIGWEVWYDDSDNTSVENNKWMRDHQVGWGYIGPAYYNADAFQELELGAPPQPQLRVIVPNGGEIWNVGSDQEIKWDSQNNSDSVTIELSRDGGNSWETLFASTPDDHSQMWTVTDPPSNNCKIRITDVDGSPSDVSDVVFTIDPKQIMMLEIPNGGEIWQTGTNQTISWNSTGTSGIVKIELSRNGGNGWETLFMNTPDDHSESWSVIGPASKNCKIKITDIDGAPSDTSDNLFTIGPEWIVPITISDGNVTFVRNFGGDMNATDSFNSDIDVETAPPGMTYYSYFEIAMFPYYLETDIRKWISPYTNEINWTLKIINANGVTSSLFWNPAKLPPQGSFFMMGTGLDVDMRNKNLVAITDTATLSIHYTLVDSVTFNFPQAGWYLISLPVIPANNNLRTLFPVAIAAFAYNSTTRNYYQVSNLEVKKGYWLSIPEKTTATISGTQLMTYTENYTTGWHLIGSVWDTTNFTDPNDNPDCSVIAAHGYYPATGQYFAVYPSGTGKLEKKQGFWLGVMQSCNLTIGGDGVAKEFLPSTHSAIAFYQQFGAQPPGLPIVANHRVAELVTDRNKIVSCNYPNPFNPETIIEYSLPRAGLTQVHIYNTRGQRIRMLLAQDQTPGIHQVIWNGRNDNGELVANGIYYYQIVNSGLKETKKLLLLK
jgi:hypothetical protein